MNRRGFTVLEAVAVFALLAVTGTLAWAGANAFFGKATEELALVEMNAIVLAEKTHAATVGSYTDDPSHLGRTVSGLNVVAKPEAPDVAAAWKPSSPSNVSGEHQYVIAVNGGQLAVATHTDDDECIAIIVEPLGHTSTPGASTTETRTTAPNIDNDCTALEFIN